MKSNNHLESIYQEQCIMFPILENFQYYVSKHIAAVSPNFRISTVAYLEHCVCLKPLLCIIVLKVPTLNAS